MFYDRLQGNPTFYTLNNPPYVGSVEYEYSSLSNIKAGSTLSGPWGTLQTIDRNLRIPYSEQFSFGIQRELPWGVFSEATYVATLGRHLLDEPDINQPSFATLATVPSTVNENTIRPFAGYSTLQMFLSRCGSNYHALQLYAARRKGKVMFTAGYTFSKALGDASTDTSNNRDYFGAHALYGPLDFDVRHVFVGTAIYNLPLLTSHPFLRQPLGGWQFTTIVHLQSGFYQNVTASPAIVGSRLANYVGGPTQLANPGPNGWYNPAAFAVPLYTRWGTSGAGNIEGPGLQLFNFRLAKMFFFRERFNLRFTADFFNAFNHANFQAPTVDRSNSNFGTILAAYPPRNIQMGLMLRF